MDIMVYPISKVLGSKAAADGSTVDLVCEWEDGEKFILRMPFRAASSAQVALQDAASDAAIRGGREHTRVIAEALGLQASPVSGHDILTVRLDGGMQVQFQVPARYESGIPRLGKEAPGQDRSGDA